MKKLLLLVGLVVFLTPMVVSALNSTSKYDHYYKRVISRADSFNQNIYPYKLKFCKNKDTNQTMSIFNNQSCLFRYQQGSMIKLKNGKKIKRTEYINFNPDFSENNNLTCLTRKDHREIYIAFITHTPSNKVYLNSLVAATRNDINSLGDGKPTLDYIDNNNYKTKYYHQGISTKEGAKGYLFKFIAYHNKDLQEEPWYLGDMYIQNNFSENIEDEFEESKCYASDDYWNTMFDKEYMVASNEKKQDKVAKASNTQSSSTSTTSVKVNYVPKYLTSNEKFISLHDRAYEEGKKTIVFDDGKTYLVGNKKLRAKTIAASQTPQVTTQVLNKDKIKEELSYYKELFEEELIEKSEYDDLRKTLLAGIKEGSVTKTIIMNQPDNVAIQSQSDLTNLQAQLDLEKRKVEAMESQAQAAQNTNKIIKEQQRKKGWNALMQLGLGMAAGNYGPGANQRQTNCYDSAMGFKCTSYDW